MAEAVKPKHGGIFSAVMQYSGTFLAVGGFHLSAVMTLAQAVKPKYGCIFSAVMQYGGNVLAVGGFFVFRR